MGHSKHCKHSLQLPGLILALKHCTWSSGQGTHQDLRGIHTHPCPCPMMVSICVHNPTGRADAKIKLWRLCSKANRSIWEGEVHPTLKIKQCEDLTAWNALTPTQADPQALPRKEKKEACEKELSETVLFLLQRNWLAWSWTSGKQPKINGENSVGINPRSAALHTHPAALLLRHFTAHGGLWLRDYVHEVRTGGTQIFLNPTLPKDEMQHSPS